MEQSQEEAEKAMKQAEEKFKANDLEGAIQLALKAKALFPSLRGLPQVLTAYGVHVAAAEKKKKFGGTDWHAVLGVDLRFELKAIKKQFNKMCIMTHPDKNGSAAADGAFKLVMQAWESISASHRAAQDNDPPPTRADDDHPPPTKADDDHPPPTKADDDHPPPTEANDDDSYDQDENHSQNDGHSTSETEPPPRPPREKQDGKDQASDEPVDPPAAKESPGLRRVACPKCGKDCKHRLISGHGFIRCKHSRLYGDQDGLKYDYYHVVLLEGEATVYHKVEFRGGHCSNTNYYKGKKTETNANYRSRKGNYKKKHHFNAK